MRILLPVFALLLLGCSSAPPPAEKHSAFQCPAGEFQGSGFGATESDALGMAHGELAKQINMSVKVTVESAVSQRMDNGKESLSSDYASKTVMEADISNAHDARIGRKEWKAKGIGIDVCMSRADAAKGFLWRQRAIADSLEIASGAEISEKRPKPKKEAWNRAHELWNRFVAAQNMLEGLGAAREDYLSSAGEAYSKAKEDYNGYCQSAKLHWNPERESEYSEIAFAKLSNGAEMEKSPCSGRGISIAYKGAEPECAFMYGINSCSYKPSLSLSSCEGAEYLQLGGEAMSAHKNPELAAEKLRSNFKSAEFLDKWMQEIKEWSPICE